MGGSAAPHSWQAPRARAWRVPARDVGDAREAALANRRAVHAGGDPLAEKRRARGVPTFAEAARKVFELRRDGWRNAKHAGQWITTLEQFVFPRIGARGVDEISAEDVIAVLSPIWHAKPTTAKRVRQRIGAVLTWAVAQGLRPDNPADAVNSTLGIASERGNCDCCYLKSRPNLLATIRDEPSRADWWIDAERRSGRTFRAGESFEALKAATLAQVDTADISAGDVDGGEALPCFCTD